MSISVVVGGQYGSEGKGKVALHFAKELKAVAVVKVGGTNAGHTVYDEQGAKHILRVLPTACVTDDVVCVIGPGAVISLELLFKEMKEVGLTGGRLLIHPNTGIITSTMEREEKWSADLNGIGSTTSGTGAATVHRIARDSQFVRACEVGDLDQYLVDTTDTMDWWLRNGKNIIIEGCQGFGLSIYHTPQYPYATSRDTTASSFVSEAGLSIFDVENVIQVLRTYEIRVAGMSGPMKSETTWDRVTLNAKSPVPIIEKTSVSKKVRRVGYFDSELVRRSTIINKPNITVLNFMDYIGEEGHNCCEHVLGSNRKEFIAQVQENTGCQVTHVGFDGVGVECTKDCLT